MRRGQRLVNAAACIDRAHVRRSVYAARASFGFEVEVPGGVIMSIARFPQGTRPFLLALLALSCMAPSTGAQSAVAPSASQSASEQARDPEAWPDVALVQIDGRTLFPVAGLYTHPAAERARAIADRISKAAEARADSSDTLTFAEAELGTQIFAGDRLMLLVSEADARLEDLPRVHVASIRRMQIRQAIEAYRSERSRDRLVGAAIRAAGATVLLVVLLLLLAWLRRRIGNAAQLLVRTRVKDVKIQSLEILRAESLHKAIEGSIGAVRVVAVLVLLFLYLNYILSLMPWTRALAHGMLGYVLDPVRTMGKGLIDYLPNLLFLTVLALLMKLVLWLLRLITTSIARGVVKLPSFHAEWAWPTYGLVRFGVVALMLVIAFPYIPGSSSPAFQGVSIFVGVLFSLGSSSLMGNLVAGYSLVYWRALRVGDRVQIGDVLGEVVEMRHMVTHLRTPKNEEVVIPNSLILSGKIVNYSSLAKERGLILHTTVGIGYEVPWRQVEAMLLVAAGRTRSLLAEPKPFVLQRGLGDFAVTYELNAYTDSPLRMLASYNELHGNILDVFNEHGVQIMTPAYEGDPPEPKVVSKENWHASPATPPSSS
jgi:small-conductance mechanosensitive channel